MPPAITAVRPIPVPQRRPGLDHTDPGLAFGRDIIHDPFNTGVQDLRDSKPIRLQTEHHPFPALQSFSHTPAMITSTVANRWRMALCSYRNRFFSPLKANLKLLARARMEISCVIDINFGPGLKCFIVNFVLQSVCRKIRPGGSCNMGCKESCSFISEDRRDVDGADRFCPSRQQVFVFHPAVREKNGAPF